MKKLASLCAAGLTAWVCASAQAEPAGSASGPADDRPAQGEKLYISDEMTIMARSGPGPDYKAVSAMRVGDEVMFVQSSPSGRYYQIQKDRGSKVWVESKLLVKEPVGHSQIALLNAKIKELEERFANYDNELARELKATLARLERLQKENQGQAAAILQKDETISELDEIRRSYMDKLETRELDMQMRWWVQGAVIALFGAAAGVALVYIPRPDNKKKFKNRF